MQLLNWSKLLVSTTLSCLSLAALAACSSSTPPIGAANAASLDEAAAADWGYVGEVDGTDAFIAVVVGGEEAVIYVCNGAEEIAEWFSGSVLSDGAIDVDNDAGARVVATVGDDAIEGTVTLPDGSLHAFSTEPAVIGAGLYRVTGDEAKAAEITAGWVVANDGEQRGSLRIRGANKTVPALPNGTLKVSDTEATVSVFLAKTPAPAGPIPIPYPIITTTK